MSLQDDLQPHRNQLSVITEVFSDSSELRTNSVFLTTKKKEIYIRCSGLQGMGRLTYSTWPSLPQRFLDTNIYFSYVRV